MERIGVLRLCLQYLLVDRLRLRQAASAMMRQRGLQGGLSRCALGCGIAALASHTTLLVFLAATAGAGIVATGAHGKPRLNIAFLVFIIDNLSWTCLKPDSTEIEPQPPAARAATAKKL
jgi:hypothetical protein